VLEKTNVVVLKEVTAVEFAPGKCGDYAWGIKWRMKEPAGPTGATVIQSIEDRAKVWGCDGTLLKEFTRREFWEAWSIPPCPFGKRARINLGNLVRCASWFEFIRRRTVHACQEREWDSAVPIDAENSPARKIDHPPARRRAERPGE